MLSSSFGLKLKTPAQMSANNRRSRRSMSRNRRRKDAVSQQYDVQPINGSVTRRVDCQPIRESVTSRWLNTSFDMSPERCSNIGEQENTNQLSVKVTNQRQVIVCPTPKQNPRRQGLRNSTPKRDGEFDSPLRDTRTSTPTRFRVNRRSMRSTRRHLNQTDNQVVKDRHCPMGEPEPNGTKQKKASHSVYLPRLENPTDVKDECILLSKTHSIISGLDIGVDSMADSRPIDHSFNDFFQCADMDNLESLMNFYDRIVNKTDTKYQAPVRSTYV